MLDHLTQHIAKFPLRRVPSKRAIAGLLFALVLFGYLGWRAYQGVPQLVQLRVEFTANRLLMALVFQSVGVLLAAAVWSDILRRLGVEVGYLFNLQVFCASAVARKIPGTVWYALGRIALYERTGQSRRPIIMALIIEATVIALAGLVVFGVSLGTGLIHLPGIGDVRYLVVLMAILFAGALLIQPLALQFVFKRMRKDAAGASDDQLTPVDIGDTLRWLLGSIGVITLGAGVSFFSMKSVDVNMAIPFVSVLGAWGLAVAIGPAVMWLPGDVGLKDGFMYLALSPVISGPLAAVATLAWRLSVTLMELLFGLICAVSLSRSISIFGEGWKDSSD